MKELLTRSTCDRCAVVIDEQHSNGESEDEKTGEPQLRVGGQLLKIPPIQFDDLCAKCKARIVSLIEAILKTGKGKRKKTKAVKAKAKAKAKGKSGSGSKGKGKGKGGDDDFSDVPPG